MPEAPVIRTKNLTKVYGDLHAVDDLDLDVGRGEIFGYLGPNGSGKTTTIKCLLDLAHPTSGTAEVLGYDSRTDPVEIRRRIGYIPGDLALYPKLTGGQLLTYFANLRGGVDETFVGELAERFGADLTRRNSDYSTGNRQKIGVIQAFMHRPELLILDEPSAGLDPLVQQEFQALLREVRDEGRTVFLSSHTLSEVERVAGRVGIIRHGKLVVVEDVDVLKRKAIRRLDFEFAEPVPGDTFDGVEGVRSATVDGRHASVSFEGSVNAMLHAAMRHEVVNLNSRESDLDEIFLAYYRDDEEATSGGTVPTDGAPTETASTESPSTDSSAPVR